VLSLRLLSSPESPVSPRLSQPPVTLARCASAMIPALILLRIRPPLARIIHNESLARDIVQTLNLTDF
jgi:hypothetical protein